MTEGTLPLDKRIRNPGDSAFMGDATTPVRTDPTGTTAQPVTDNAGSLTIDGSVALLAGAANVGDVDIASPLGGGTEAAAVRVTVANDSTGLLSVDDNAGSLTVDQATATSLKAEVVGPTADNAANPTAKLAVLAAKALAAAPTLTEGNVNPLRVTLAGDAAVTLDGEAVVLGAGAAVIGALTANQSMNMAQVAGAATVTGGVAGSQGIGGLAAHDAPVAGSPVLIAGRANLNEPAVVADGDAVDIWADQLGRQVVLLGHSNTEPPVTVNGSGAGTVVIATPGASLSLYIQKGSVHNRAAATQVVSLRDGAAGTIRWTAMVAKDGGGSLIDFGARGWKLTANTALVADIGAASADINISEYYIAA